jgi:hypothetical protein
MHLVWVIARLMGSVDARNWMLLVLSNAGKVGEGFRYLIMMFSHLFSLDTTLEVCFSNEICWKNSVPCNSLLLFAIEDYFEWLSCKFCWKRGRKYHCLLFYHVFVLATLCRVWIVFFFFLSWRFDLSCFTGVFLHSVRYKRAMRPPPRHTGAPP